jgi:diphthine synthase
MGLSLRGLEECRSADRVFIELYTSLLPDFSQKHLEKISQKKFHAISRRQLEEENGEIILEATKTGKSVLLVPGDPLIATTHISLRLEAKKRGVKTRVVHGSSILSAAIGLSGLHNYKFGKSVTIPFPDETPPETPYSVIAQNKERGLHTLCLLDIKVEKRRFLSIHDGLSALLKVEAKRKEKAAAMGTLVVGIARAGSDTPAVRAGFIRDLLDYDFGEVPHSLIFPGKLHFMEAEALIMLADAPDELREVAE